MSTSASRSVSTGGLIHEALRAYGQIGSGQDGSKAIERLKAPYADAVQSAAKQ